MKKLYYCSADCSAFSLRSYSTYVWDCSDGYCRLRMYRSATTYQHYRKYSKWLCENEFYHAYKIFMKLYSICMTKQKGIRPDYAIYNVDTGEVNTFYTRQAYKDFIIKNHIHESNPL